ncbi:hypothetical protein HMPREF9123_1261 [Neisseria bacilliformis ATCC BAA-1200]|uniref:Uncharacterized protein n=1 Tax=Neisseria bacilliformis ATCC BAA-1200 TaxID=888742 RepID=F2BC06_9NEIS|nr:hypothetical protein HMPREF9123_1261 [Neisseria bacilliformis ATCC BAA-1200]
MSPRGDARGFCRITDACHDAKPQKPREWLAPHTLQRQRPSEKSANLLFRNVIPA